MMLIWQFLLKWWWRQWKLTHKPRIHSQFSVDLTPELTAVLDVLRLGFVELCVKILQIMRSDFKDYARTSCQLCTHFAHLYRPCITHIGHSKSTMRHYLVYITNMLLSSVPSVINSDVMSLSDWLLFSHLPVLTTATSSLWVSWCPVHISAAAVSPSCGNTYWSRLLHCVNSTGFQSLRGYSVSCVCCYTTHLSATLRLCGIRHSCLRQSLAFCRAQLFDWWETVTSTCDKRWRASFLHCCIVRI